MYVMLNSCDCPNKIGTGSVRGYHEVISGELFNMVTISDVWVSPYSVPSEGFTVKYHVSPFDV